MEPLRNNNFYFDKKSGMYLRESEQFCLFMAPVRYLRLNSENNFIPRGYISNTPDILLFTLQSEMQSLLNMFLSGVDLSQFNRIIFPFRNRISKNTIQKLRNIDFLINELQSKYHSSFENWTNFGKPILNQVSIRSEDLAIALSSLYRDLEVNIQDSSHSAHKYHVEVSAFDDNEYQQLDEEYTKPLILLKERAKTFLQEYVSGFYLHGSMATIDYVKGWSDVDTLLIIRKETIKNPKRLLSLRNEAYKLTSFFYLIDPLQHHGYFVFTEYDMMFYPQPYFPLVLFDYAKTCFVDLNDLIFYERDSSIERLHSLWNLCYLFREAYLTQKKIKTLYELKAYLHVLLLLPSLYLQAKGEPCYKKYSFEKAKRDFEEEIWKVINYATTIREEWKDVSLFPRNLARQIIKFPNPLTLSLPHRLLKLKPHNRAQINIQPDIIYNCFRLSESILQLVQGIAS